MTGITAVHLIMTGVDVPRSGRWVCREGGRFFGRFGFVPRWSYFVSRIMWLLWLRYEIRLGGDVPLAGRRCRLLVIVPDSWFGNRCGFSDILNM